MIVVLTGLTATGKTELLHSLAEMGEQIVDLESLARHRGSAFGNLGEVRQPSHTQFHALVNAALAGAEAGRPLWIEDENDYIGSVGLPESLIEAMRGAACLEVVAPLEQRVARIMFNYGRYRLELWQQAVSRIAPRLGETRTELVRSALAVDDLEAAVRTLLVYYDAAYRHRTQKLGRKVLASVTASDARGSLALTAQM